MPYIHMFACHIYIVCTCIFLLLLLHYTCMENLRFKFQQWLRKCDILIIYKRIYHFDINFQLYISIYRALLKYANFATEKNLARQKRQKLSLLKKQEGKTSLITSKVLITWLGFESFAKFWKVLQNFESFAKFCKGFITWLAGCKDLEICSKVYKMYSYGQTLWSHSHLCMITFCMITCVCLMIVIILIQDMIISWLQYLRRSQEWVVIWSYER